MTKNTTGLASWQQNLRAVWFAELMAIVGFYVVIPILPLYIRELGVEADRQTRIWSGVIFSAHSVTMAVFAPIWGTLSDRVGYRSILAACALLSVLCYAPQSMTARPMWLIPLQAGAGLAMGGILTSVRALLAALGPKGREGIVFGVENTVSSIANAIGPMSGSALAAALGLRAPFLAAATVFGVGTLATFRLLPKE